MMSPNELPAPPVRQSQPHSPHSLRYLVFAVAAVAVAVAVWNLNARLTTLRSENSALQTTLRGARAAVVPHAQDAVAQAIRLLSDDFEQHQEPIRLLITRWGKISEQATPSLDSRLDELGMEVITFHCEHNIWTTPPAFNTTVSILRDRRGNVIDTFHYDSDLSRETHSLVQAGPTRWILAISTRKTLDGGRHSQRPSLYRCWEATPEGFLERNSPTQIGLDIAPSPPPLPVGLGKRDG